ncbi:MAG: hypothetical protein Fur0014_10320 [Rubrivivax sp.]
MRLYGRAARDPITGITLLAGFASTVGWPLGASLMASVFAVTWFVSTAMASHLPQLLQGAGVGLAGAVRAGALIGPAQVAGRVLEFGLRRLQPLFSARGAALGHPLGALWLSAGLCLSAFVVLLGLPRWAGASRS